MVGYISEEGEGFLSNEWISFMKRKTREGGGETELRFPLSPIFCLNPDKFHNVPLPARPSQRLN